MSLVDVKGSENELVDRLARFFGGVFVSEGYSPCHSPIQTVVFQMEPSHIDTVLVDGEPVKRNGELLNPIVSEEFDRFVESGCRLVDEAGLDL